MLGALSKDCPRAFVAQATLRYGIGCDAIIDYVKILKSTLQSNHARPGDQRIRLVVIPVELSRIDYFSSYRIRSQASAITARAS